MLLLLLLLLLPVTMMTMMTAPVLIIHCLLRFRSNRMKHSTRPLQRSQTNCFHCSLSIFGFLDLSSFVPICFSTEKFLNHRSALFATGVRIDRDCFSLSSALQSFTIVYRCGRNALLTLNTSFALSLSFGCINFLVQHQLAFY